MHRYGSHLLIDLKGLQEILDRLVVVTLRLVCHPDLIVPEMPPYASCVILIIMMDDHASTRDPKTKLRECPRQD